IITLDGPVHATVLTDDAGAYRFANLPDGVYSVAETQHPALIDGLDVQGAPRLGRVENDRFVDLALTGGVDAAGYNFAERGVKNVNKTLLLASTPSAIHLINDLMGTVGPSPNSLPGAPLPSSVGPAGLLHNPTLPLDVSGDGFVSPADALLIVNALNAPAGGELGTTSFAYLDTNNDGFITPQDALLIVNHLNSLASSNGEGESLRTTAAEHEAAATSYEWGNPHQHDELLDETLELLAQELVAKKLTSGTRPRD
ncbi:MAG TPA: dockerin type I domain-containing protein, partial [Pirellulaceae bacterium]|nr:dockerin type I domain-containing protein [Pirellulaceae bacterium]